jgi:hypothetical protein
MFPVHKRQASVAGSDKSSAPRAVHRGKLQRGLEEAREGACYFMQEGMSEGVTTGEDGEEGLAPSQDLWRDHHSAVTIVGEYDQLINAGESGSQQKWFQNPIAGDRERGAPLGAQGRLP